MTLKLMRGHSHIPKNKFDFAAVDQLCLLPFEVVKKDVLLLMEWLQDGNWPVAEGIAKYLKPHVNEISPELIAVFKGDDSMWKYWILHGLILQFPGKLDQNLIAAIRNIAEHPSNIEIEDGVDKAAKDVIDNKILCG